MKTFEKEPKNTLIKLIEESRRLNKKKKILLNKFWVKNSKKITLRLIFIGIQTSEIPSILGEQWTWPRSSSVVPPDFWFGHDQ